MAKNRSVYCINFHLICNNYLQFFLELILLKYCYKRIRMMQNYLQREQTQEVYYKTKSSGLFYHFLLHTHNSLNCRTSKFFISYWFTLLCCNIIKTALYRSSRQRNFVWPRFEVATARVCVKGQFAFNYKITMKSNNVHGDASKDTCIPPEYVRCSNTLRSTNGPNNCFHRYVPRLQECVD